MNSYFVLNRRGNFKPSKMSANQCTAPATELYYYQIGLVFDGAMPLDGDDFIIKHEEIDEIVQSIEHRGSCEAMQLRIAKKIVPYLAKKDLPVLAYKCTIKATADPNENPGIQYVAIRAAQYAHCLSLI